MRAFLAFTKKEWLELIRTGKCVLLLILFTLFGIMNPAIAKLTPWMMEMLSADLSDMGLILTETNVDALTSWAQFYKNIPMGLLIFLLLFGGILTTEYQRGTLVHMLTKGLKRWKVILAKAGVMVSAWTLCYWLCFGITYGYNQYFWDNRAAEHLLFAAFCTYLGGIWMISLLLLMSVIFTTSSGVLAATGGAALSFYLAGLIPKITEYLPVRLLGASGMLSGLETPNDYRYAVWITLCLSGAAVLLAVKLFNRK
ncbi:MAG: ABC transporter permease subunit [Dorea sp.]|jgi:ABC-2 type transport system permease protein|nr:ABC transporter permease subunit [Dorea sp.]